MVKAPRRKAPSRIRYEQSHPTVSCRVPTEVYERLQAVKEAEGRSFADILKVGLGILELEEKNEEEIRETGYADGYRKGYAQAERIFKVTYPCKICGGVLTVRTSEEKEAIKAYMRERGWGHRECHEGRR